MLEKGFSIPELAEPILPEPPSWLPLPAGWLVMGGILLIALLVFALIRLARWRRNLWRRQALEAIEQSHSVDSWLVLIKRILLVHHTRQTISAYLDPVLWLSDLPLDADIRDQLCQRYCQPENHLSEEETFRLRQQLRSWIEGLPYV
ncbi:MULTISPECIES: DUF4381 domain-containing protein [Enterobacter]|uniref:DUF4381 domain-containing protein n=1 Tax=Enterobacter TaxID=547 RepID=UPI001C8E54C5|nr:MULTISPECIES: DUF4381 domain-containing protein [Enterobacter]MBY0632460.1 DUF4381 domain-containing protein [Enterobacter sp. NIC22-4]